MGGKGKARMMSTVVSVKGVPRVGEKRKAVQVEGGDETNGKEREKDGHHRKSKSKSGGPGGGGHHGGKKAKR